MKKLLDFISKHYIVVIICLIVLLIGKSCQSCTRKNTIVYNKYEYQSQIDSIQSMNNYYKDSILYLNTQNTILRNELDGCKVELEKLEKRYDNINSINKNIQTTNNKLINKLTEKEL